MLESVVKQKIMISSTRADLAQYREEASKIIKRVAAEKEKWVQLVEVLMEKETQSGDREFAVAVSKRWVEESNWVVVIVGWNYGTISDEEDANGLSVTEWEYRHAFHLQKKLFVFIAGDPGTANQYRVSVDEREDLKDWGPKQTPEQAEKLKKFKQELGKPHAEMFANLQMFRERLEKTLKDAIDDLSPAIPPGSPLAELIVAVRPAIKDCSRKVALIDNCKRIHDQLHDLRQYVIRRLREEVIPGWQQNGALDVSREKRICGCVKKAAEKLGAIRERGMLIGAEHGVLRDSIDRLLKRPELWDIESDSPETRPSIENFVEAVRRFSQAVQDAFHEADSSMKQEVRSFDDLYVALLEGLKEAEHNRNLSATENQRLNDKLCNVKTTRSRVRASLETHHSWQEAHLSLYVLDSFRGTDIFEARLRDYSDTSLGKLVRLVGEQLEQIDVGQKGGAETVERTRAAAVGQSPLPPSGDPPACDIFVDNLQRLKKGIEALRDLSEVDAFDKMRMAFDDTFYSLDKRTLGEVNAARTQVDDFENLLDELAKGRHKAD